jgi:hypothetical protein
MMTLSASADGLGHGVGLGFDHLAVDGFRRGRLAAPAAEDDRHEGAVHALAHDVGQDRARGTDQGAGDDQQVVAQREADGGRRPARVGVEHRDHDRHVGAADGQDQVAADGAGDDGDQQHGPEAGAAEVQVAEGEAGDQGGQVQHVAARQGQRGRAQLAGELAVGDDRAGEGDRADQDAEEQLDLEDADLDRRLLGDGRGESRQLTGTCRRTWRPARGPFRGER